jgi:pheromone a factor receptor
MCICILVPYLPIHITLVVVTIVQNMPWTKQYNFHQLHYGDGSLPYPQDTIWPLTSGEVDAKVMEACYIPILAAVPIIILFGATPEAINTYRKLLLFLGFGRLFPSLHTEYTENHTSSKTSMANKYVTP